MSMTNYLKCEFAAISQNEAMVRSVASAFLVQFDPTLEEMADIRTAVSEAVTNAIIHGYGVGRVDMEALNLDKENDGKFFVVGLECRREGNTAVITISDEGCGILDIEKAKQPMYTSAPPELDRSGLGFSIMESCSDKMEVFSESGKGTRVVLTKHFGCDPER